MSARNDRITAEEQTKKVGMGLPFVTFHLGHVFPFFIGGIRLSLCISPVTSNVSIWPSHHHFHHPFSFPLSHSTLPPTLDTG
jgi:hypothetical protein